MIMKDFINFISEFMTIEELFLAGIGLIFMIISTAVRRSTRSGAASLTRLLQFLEVTLSAGRDLWASTLTSLYGAVSQTRTF